MRPSFNKTILDILQIMKQRSTCKRRKVAAIIVKDKRIISTGFNGAPSGISHCSEHDCIRDKYNIPSGERHEFCRGAHAELNAIAHAARYGISTENCDIYITTYPCGYCTKAIINAGIKNIYYIEDYKDNISYNLINEHNEVNAYKLTL